MNIIPSDIVRDMWTFRDRELACLQQVLCDYSFGFQGFDFNTNRTEAEILRAVAEAIANQNKEARPQLKVTPFGQISKV